MMQFLGKGMLSMKIVLCGPPHSGKSCVRYGLKEAIKGVSESLYPYVITACPDGEGCWFQETAAGNPDLAKALKAPYKSGFTHDRARVMAEWVRDCSAPLTLIDIGGIPDAKNEAICSHATHAILLYVDTDQLSEWRRFCEKTQLRIIAEIHSDYHGEADHNPHLGNDGIHRGSIHRLERGDLSIKERPTVMELARIVVQLATEEE